MSENTPKYPVPVISAIIERQREGQTEVLVQTRWKPGVDLKYSGTLEISDSFLGRAFYSLYFSVITFATLGQSNFEPKAYMRPFVMIEALLGIFMIVLFVLVFGRKMMRR